MKMSLLVIVAMMVFALLPTCKAQVVTMIGVVEDFEGIPLGGVIVEAYRSGSFIGSTSTLPNGYFSFPLPSTGTYEIVVYKRGYEKITLRLDLLSGGTINIGRLKLGYAIKVITDATHIVINQGDTVELPLSVENAGAFLEEVKILVDAPPSWSSELISELGFVAKSIMLSPGQRRTFKLRIHVPGNALGPVNITVGFLYANISKIQTVIVEATAKDWGFTQVLYPEVASFAGGTVQTPVRIRNNLPVACIVNISITAPRGWKALLMVDNVEASSLRLDPGETITATLLIRIPEGALPGRYDVTISAQALDIASRSTLSINVIAGYDYLTMETPTPVVNVYPGESTAVTVTVSNEGTKTSMTIFEVTGLPSGFTWSIKDELGNTVTAIRLPPRTSQKVLLQVDVPRTTPPSAISLSLRAKGINSSAVLELGINILGRPSINILTQNWEVEVTAGSSTVVQLLLENDGQIPLDLVAVDTAGQPIEGVRVEAEPSRIMNLPPGGRTMSTLTVVVDERVSPGRYFIPIVVSSRGIKIERILALNVRTGGGLFYVVISLLIVALALTAFLLSRVKGRGDAS